MSSGKTDLQERLSVTKNRWFCGDRLTEGSVQSCLIRSFHRRKFIGCSKVREKEIKRRKYICAAARQMWASQGLCRSKSSQSPPTEKYGQLSCCSGRKYEIRVSPREIGLIGGDKYGSLRQLAHTWLPSLGWVGAPAISSPRLAFVHQIMRQISSAGNFTSGNMSHGKMDLEKPVLKQETFQDKMIRQKPDKST